MHPGHTENHPALAGTGKSCCTGGRRQKPPAGVR